MSIMSPHVRESKFRNPGNVLLVESGIREGFTPGIRNTAQGVRNPTSPAAQPFLVSSRNAPGE